MRRMPKVMLGIVLAAGLLAGAIASGCARTNTQANSAGSGSSTEAAPSEEPTNTTGGTVLYVPEYKPIGKEVAVFDTSRGTIKVELYGKEAPITVGNFIELAQKGFYDTTRFHRYEPGFVVQGGDPGSKGLTAEQVTSGQSNGSGPLGTGGPGYTIAGEFDAAKNPHRHTTGALGMARAQAPDTAGSQFYFVLADQSGLDGSYTVFGQVVDGLDVMQSLRIGDEIKSISIEGAQK